jgi:hypothetical protein
MTSTMVIYGLPIVAGLLAIAGYLYARHSAAEFDRRFNRHLPAGE